VREFILPRVGQSGKSAERLFKKTSHGCILA
jgi:hypothetical protein